MEDAFTLTVRYQFVKNVSEWLPFPHVKAPDPFIQSCHLAAFPFFSSPLSLGQEFGGSLVGCSGSRYIMSLQSRQVGVQS